MTKLYSFTFLFLSTFIARAQTYYPMPTANATWTIVEYGYTFPVETGVWHFGLVGDTLINSINYHKIYCNWGSLGFPNPEPQFNAATATYYGAFREDANKKVWFYHGADTAEYLYYDFALNQGDTFCFHYEPCGINCHQVILVDSVLVNGNYRRQIHFAYNGQEEKWIEGIGSAYDNWIGNWCFLGNIAWEMNCYSEEQNHVYGPCNYPAGINESNAGQIISIYPNPAHNTFTISLNELKAETGKWKMYDMTGRIVCEQKISSPHSTFNFQLSSGIYLVRVEAGEKVWQEKIVVE